MSHRSLRLIPARLIPALLAVVAYAAEFDYKVLATRKTSTLEKEMNEFAGQGYVFSSVMGGSTAGGNEGVVVMVKAARANRKYKLLAANKTSTMDRELKQAGNEGFEYKGQSVFQSSFGDREVVVILERDASAPARKIAYRLLATSRTSTMEKELNQVGADGFRLLGLTVAQTAFGGSELLCILDKPGE